MTLFFSDQSAENVAGSPWSVVMASLGILFERAWVRRLPPALKTLSATSNVLWPLLTPCENGVNTTDQVTG